MQLNDIEKQVRMYAGLSLVFDQKHLLRDQIKLKEHLDKFGNIAPGTKLSQITELIKNANPLSNPRWISNGLVIDPRFTLHELSEGDHLHENRSRDKLRHQLELLLKNLFEARTYAEIDIWYDKVNSVLKKSIKSDETLRLIEMLKFRTQKIENLTSAQTEYVFSLVSRLEQKFSSA